MNIRCCVSRGVVYTIANKMIRTEYTRLDHPCHFIIDHGEERVIDVPLFVEGGEISI